MKRLTTLLIAFITLTGFAQVNVSEKTVNIAGSKNGFYLSVPYGSVKEIEKELKEELKDWKGKFSNKEFIFVDDCRLKEMGKNTFDVFAKVETNSEGGAFVSLAVDLGGAFLSSKDHGAQAKVIQTRLHKFGVKAAKSVIDGEIKVQEKVLKERNGEFEDLVKEQEKLQKEIEDYKNKIIANEKAIEASKKSQEAKKGEIKEQEAKVKAVAQKKEAVK